MLTQISTVAVAVGLSLSCATASWADGTAASVPGTTAVSAPLAPGQASGIRRAEIMTPDNTLYVAGGLLIIGAGVALIASNNGGHQSNSTSTASPGGR